MNIGILALQGAVEPHEMKLRQLSVTPIQVRNPSDLDLLSGIILPGGESTAMIHLLKLNSLWEPLARFAAEKPTWGICAGAILLANRVTHPHQESLGLLDIEVARNAYGRQIQSFIAPLTATAEWKEESAIEGVFIRAPKITSVGRNCRSLFLYEDEVVMAESENLLVSTFHPELTDSHRLHQYFLRKCMN